MVRIIVPTKQQSSQQQQQHSRVVRGTATGVVGTGGGAPPAALAAAAATAAAPAASAGGGEAAAQRSPKRVSPQHALLQQQPRGSKPEQLQMDDDAYEALLHKRKGFIVKRMLPDGNCLFRAVADQVYGDAELHQYVREQCMNYLEKERDHFSQYVTEDFGTYLSRKRKARANGNHVELQAAAEIYNRPVEVYCYSLDPINIFQGGYATDNPPIRLSYRNGNHYDSIFDPDHPAAGVGLGLPGYNPEMDAKKALASVMRAAEDDELEDELVRATMRDTEIAGVEEDIERAVLEASRAEYLAEVCRRITVPTRAQSTATATQPTPVPAAATPPVAATATMTATSTTVAPKQ
eukprot:TRINITY_DN3516_c0_g2_i1.p1 TRINITY_DN3516_c0_g2~~TRINITY_DN3516_c0_g2_i1.p1  ORF type:complete len:360 (-),score=106.80 TRINITY_DN3516_c0_g2_i1:91-1140(-)